MGQAHPPWCGQGHLCDSHAYRGSRVGQHRSVPLTFHTDVGSVIATRVRTSTGRDQIEVRLVLSLPRADEATQALAGDVLLARVHEALARPLRTGVAA